MGKGLSVATFAELITYFSISSSPDAFPLAVLLSSIMAFGNLGEHSELTAVKSSGISLVRTLLPIFLFVLLLTGFTYYSNTHLVPKTNLKTYSLLWDMRTKKPALDIKEGVFYDGIPGYSIKVNQKMGDEQLKDIIIYDHTSDNAQGNKKVILADSGRMYSFMNQRYLALELYDGTRYEENVNETPQDKAKGGQFIRDNFTKSIIRFDLSSFDMGDTDEKLFRRSRLVQTRSELIQGIDSMQRDIYSKEEQIFTQVSTNGFRFHFVKELPVPDELSRSKAAYDSLFELRRKEIVADLKPDSVDSKSGSPEALLDNENVDVNINSAVTQLNPEQAEQLRSTRQRAPKASLPQPVKKQKRYREDQINVALQKLDDYFEQPGVSNPDYLRVTNAISYGVNNARTASNILNSRLITLENVERDQRKFIITKNQQITRSLACLVMFLIGAPIGAIIKKGGLGLPVIVSVIFFLIYYVLNTTGDKWGKEGVLDPSVAVWISNAVLIPIGFFFLKQARNDARLFEVDAYLILWERIKKPFKKNRQLEQA